MKTLRTLLLCALTLATGTAQAQKLNAGIKLGVNLAQLNGKDWNDGYRANALGGIFARLHNGKIGVQAEAFFSQSSYITGKDFYDGYKGFYNAAADSLREGRFRISYLNIPVLFQFKLVNRVWVQVGPQFSGTVSVKDVDGLVQDAKGLFRKGTVSGVGGVWVDLPFHINAGARYVFGFSDLSVNEISDSWKERNVQLHVGLTF